MTGPTTERITDCAEDSVPEPDSAEVSREVQKALPATVNAAADTVALEALLSEGLTAIQAELASKLTYDRFKEQQVERLHDELQEYKSDLLRRATEPVFHGLIKLHDHLGQLLSGLEAGSVDELSPRRLLQHLDEFRDDVEMLLGQHGVESYLVPTESFDPRRQTAVERIPVEDSSQAGIIAARVRPGFEMGGVLLRKEKVKVYVAARQPESESPTFPK